MSNFEQRLDRLAEVAIRVGLRLQKGQELVLTAPVEALPLVRRITAHAYMAGASLVTPLFSDDELTLLRFQHAPNESFERASNWLFDGMATAFCQRRGAARGRRRGSVAARRRRIRRRSRAPTARARRPIGRRSSGSSISTSTGTSSPIATPAWAKAVFPGPARRRRRGRGCGTRSSRPRASTAPTRSPNGRHNAASAAARPT